MSNKTPRGDDAERFPSFDEMTKVLTRICGRNDSVSKFEIALISAVVIGFPGVLLAIYTKDIKPGTFLTDILFPFSAYGAFFLALSGWFFGHFRLKRANDFGDVVVTLVAELEKNRKENISELTGQIAALKQEADRARDYTVSLAAKFEPHLIGEDLSSEMELCARHVKCITRNLVWAKENIEKIISAAKNDKRKTFSYIVYNGGEFGHQDRAFDNYTSIIERLESEDSSVSGRICIKFMTKKDIVQSAIASKESVCDNCETLPLGGDVVLYEEIDDTHKPLLQNKMTFVVMPTSPIGDGKGPRYDLKLAEEIQWAPIKSWFDRKWGTLT